jgi:RNA polymerase sigma-70 factor, ECF subfamily
MAGARHGAPSIERRKEEIEVVAISDPETVQPSSQNDEWGRYNSARSSRMPIEADITHLLAEWKAGNEDARNQLIPVLYEELRRMAARYLRDERSAETLQPTALVHEAYMRLVQQKLPDWESRAHFFGVAAYLMRQLLVEHARRQNTQKRGSGGIKVPFEEALTFAPESSAMIVDLDAALQALAAFDERKSKIIELRFFGGLSIDEVAQALDLSTATIGREQRLAEAWLYREMRGQE